MTFYPNDPGYQPRVLLLGGTSEIGLAIVTALRLPAAAEVILAGRDEQRLAAVGKELAAGVRTVSYDVMDTGSHQAFVDGVFAEGPVDLVISAAGVLILQDDVERDVSQAAAMIETDFTGHVSTLLAVAARMRAQAARGKQPCRGTIVVLSSVAAIRPRKANPVYGAAKAGLDAFARGLADRLHGTGVRVLLVRPGFVTGRMTAGMPPAPLATTPQAVGEATAKALDGSRDTVWVPPALAGHRPASRAETDMAPHFPLSAAPRPAPVPSQPQVDSSAVRVLVAEDDEGLGQVLARGLREQGYVVDLVPDGETAASFLRLYQYEVAVLDWRMPRLSGLDLVRRLRRAGTPTPVLMLTARDTPADRIAGLDAGADDYLVKPFDFGELLARLRALQRRPPVSRSPQLVLGEVELDPAAREVTVSGQRPALTGIEFGNLEILMRRSPGVADRRSIAQHVWDNEADAFGSNTIDVHLARLRSKLAGAGVRIETVRGVGYRIITA